MNNSILLPNVPLTTCQDFQDYWDQWHKEWYKKSSAWIAARYTPTSTDSILGWPIPNNEVWKDFPEPYWGNPCNPKAVFININPAGGGGDLTLTNPINPANTLYSLYLANDGIYSKTITDLGNQNVIYPSAVSWHKRRARWTSEILGINPPLKVNAILDLDLVPWHTIKGAQMNAYLNRPGVCELIMNKIIIPAIYISNTVNPVSVFSKNIIGRGLQIQNVISLPCFNPLFVPPILTFPKPLSTRDRWNMNQLNFGIVNAKLKVYIGGYGGMALPGPGEIFLNGGVRITTRDILAL